MEGNKIVFNNSLDHKSVDLYVSENVKVSLTKERYSQLISEIIPDMQDDIQSSINRFNNANAMREKCIGFIKDIRNIFYSGGSDSDYMFKNDIDTIKENEEKLTEMLEKYSRLLGFE